MRVHKMGGERGFTLVELSLTLVIISIVMVSFFGLFISLVHSTIIAKRRDVALTLSTNQMEYLKSLPYDSLVVQSPTTSVKTVNGVSYTISTVIRYVDDAYDGCGSYPTQAEKQLYCRNYPTSGPAPVTDTVPFDYKIIHISATDNTGKQLASVDTEVAARVAETNSTTGALFVTVLDGSGAPIPGATVSVSNTTLVPVVNKSDTTDNNGVVIFYGLTPDSGNDYIITANKTGYSTLATIGASGSLQSTYPSQKIITQASAAVTLPLYPMNNDSLVLETTDTSGSPLSGVKVYAKGGYKKYTTTTDTSYYYDNLTGTDTRPTTDATGLAAITGLVPTNGYIFCGDLGDANCKIGNTTYYLAAAIPYGGSNSLQPIQVPSYLSASPPSTTFTFGATTDYMQKVRLMLTTSSTFPRVFTMNPYQLSLATASLNPFLITVTGYNLSSASVKLIKGGTTYTGSSCTSNTTQIKCSFNLSGIASGAAQLQVTNASGTLTLPTTPLGGFNVGS